MTGLGAHQLPTPGEVRFQQQRYMLMLLNNLGSL
jgi:hypothetical protein